MRRPGYDGSARCRAGARAQREAERARRVAPVRRGLLHDAGDTLPTPAYVSELGDITPEMLEPAAVGQLAAQPAGAAVLGRAGSSGASGTACGRAASAWTCRCRSASPVTFIASSGATFEPGGIFGHEVYFDSLTMSVFFLLGGRWLELRARAQGGALARGQHGAAARQRRARASDGGTERVAIARPGRRRPVRVAAGQAFPADGVLLEGAQPGRRGVAHRRIGAGGQAAGATNWWQAA